MTRAAAMSRAACPQQLPDANCCLSPEIIIRPRNQRQHEIPCSVVLTNATHYRTRKNEQAWCIFHFSILLFRRLPRCFRRPREWKRRRKIYSRTASAVYTFRFVFLANIEESEKNILFGACYVYFLSVSLFVI